MLPSSLKYQGFMSSGFPKFPSQSGTLPRLYEVFQLHLVAIHEGRVGSRREHNCDRSLKWGLCCCQICRNPQGPWSLIDSPESSSQTSFKTWELWRLQLWSWLGRTALTLVTPLRRPVVILTSPGSGRRFDWRLNILVASFTQMNRWKKMRGRSCSLGQQTTLSCHGPSSMRWLSLSLSLSSSPNPPANLLKVATNLDAELHKYEDRGHFMDPKFPELIKAVKYIAS